MADSSMKHIDEFLLIAAHDLGLEVIFAKDRNAFQLAGVHLINPSYDEIMEAIAKALGIGLKFVICYTKTLD
jgi:hypothetical protein